MKGPGGQLGLLATATFLSRELSAGRGEFAGLTSRQDDQSPEWTQVFSPGKIPQSRGKLTHSQDTMVPLRGSSARASQPLP